MNFELIKYEIKNKTAIIKLNRPNVLNSFNQKMAKEFQTALRESEHNSDVRAILVTGEGKAFCAGQDLAEAVPKEGHKADIAQIIRESYNPIILMIREIPKPVICAVNGVAAGAGANVALACDIVVASQSASFIQAFSKIGLIPDSGGTFFLPRLIGLPRASALMMLGDKVSSETAFEYGMIYKVFANDKLMEEAESLAEYMSTQPTKAYALIKKALNNSLNNSLEEQLELEKKLQAEASESYDYNEGVKAFLEKRKPNFKGE